MSKDQTISPAIPAAGAALLGLHAFALLLLPRLPGVAGTPLARNWGFNAWSYAPGWAQIAAYAIALLALLPPVNAWILGALSGGLGGALSAARRRPRLAAAVASLGAIALFWLLRQKYAFLGDGYLLASEIEAGHAGFPHAGALRLAIWLRAALGAWSVSGVTALQILSVLSGGAFVALALRFASRLGREPGATPGTAAAVLVWILAIGPLQYFFGYVELYAPLAALVLAFVVAGLADLERGRPPLLPTALVLGGALLHLLALACAPALVVLWWIHLRGRRPRAAKALLLASIAGFALLLVAYRVLPQFRTLDRFWLPILPGNGKTFALLSPAHFVEVVNAQLLGAPLAWPLLALAILSARRRGAVLDARSLVLAVLSATLLAGSLVFDFSLGARDWDLQAFACVPLALLVADLFFRRAAPALPPRTVSYVALAAGLLSTLAVIPWIGINHGDVSRQWVEDALATDPNDYYRDKPPALALASIFGSAGLIESSLDVSVRALEARPYDTRILFNVGFALQQLGRFAEAAFYFDRASRAAPGYGPPKKGLFICYDKMGRLADALEAGEGYIAVGGGDLDVYARAAAIAFTLCRFEESARILDAGIRDFPADERLPVARRTVAGIFQIIPRLPAGTSLASPDAILAAAEERAGAGAIGDARFLYALAQGVGADSSRIRAGLAALEGR